MSAEVVVVGSCMTDLVSYVSRLPRPGETIHGKSFAKGFGGKGANQCVMAARLGAKTAMVAKVGDDEFGRSTLQNFKSNGVNIDFLQTTNEAPSGVAPITVDDRGENSIIIVSGANSALTPADVGKAAELILAAKVVICQLEVPSETTLEALKLGRNGRAVTIFNAAPGMMDLSEEFFLNTDILCVNETEAELLCGLPVTDMPTASKAVEALAAKGVGSVVLTMCEQGALFTEPGVTPTSIQHVATDTVSVVDTTGAGDAFVGALAYYLAGYKDILSFSEMIRRSCRIASHTVTLPGTQTSYQTGNLPQELFKR